MVVGFTGTRSGMSEYQKKMVEKFLTENKVTTGVHGGCVGADIDFHDICMKMDIVVHVRPGHSSKDPENTKFRGDYTGAHKVYESDSHFARNRAIVNQCDYLLGTPYNDNQKGGTWYTINYAHEVGKEYQIIIR